MNAYLVVILIAVLFGAAAQVVAGIGFSLVCAPFFAIALGGGDGVRLTNFLAIAISGFILLSEGRGANLRQAARLLVPALVVIPVVGLLEAQVSPRLLSVATGILILVAVGALVSGLRIGRLTGRIGALLAGAVSGASNVVSGVGGPAVASYAANANWPPATLRPTLAAYFLGINTMSVLVRGIPIVSDTIAFGIGGALLGGLGIGALLAGRLNREVIQRVTLGMAAVGALGVIFNGLL